MIPVSSVLGDRFDPADVAGRIVLIGATAAEFQDLWTTPLGPNRPGVYVQAIGIRTQLADLAGQPVLRPVEHRRALALALALSVLAAAVGTASYRRRILGLGLLGAGAVTLSITLLIRYGLLLDPVVLLGVVGAHYVTGLESVRLYFQRRLLERELSLTTLCSVGEATTGTGNTPSLELAISLLGDVVEADGVALFRTDSEHQLDTERLVWHKESWGQVGDLVTAKRVLVEGNTRVFADAIPGRVQADGIAVYCPLFAAQTPVGVLVVERHSSRELDEIQVRTIVAVGCQLALSIENLRLLENVKATFSASIASIASAVEARHGYTEYHCRRLAAFSTTMAQHMDLPEQEIEAIQLGALLHDVGKIGIPDAMLLKPGRFTDEDRMKMAEHPEIGHRIIRPIPGLSPTTLACVRHHHESWDGSGYPDGLAGSDIPLGARIVSVVDMWDALSSKRPYKPALPQEQVRELMWKAAGAHLDPLLVPLFFRILDDESPDMLALIDSTNLSDQGMG
jgi:HD-GYP domain-containing protein (c-di-GMP phosphodiesterase class II)